jgi:hypothetical protein
MQPGRENKNGRPIGPSAAEPTMIPDFPENRQNNREFFKIFGSVLTLPFVEYTKQFTTKLQSRRGIRNRDFSAVRRLGKGGQGVSISSRRSFRHCPRRPPSQCGTAWAKAEWRRTEFQRTGRLCPPLRASGLSRAKKRPRVSCGVTAAPPPSWRPPSAQGCAARCWRGPPRRSGRARPYPRCSTGSPPCSGPCRRPGCSACRSPR